MKTFNERTQKLKDVINERFGRYGIDGREAYEQQHIFSDELKSKPDEHILEVLDNKHISHIMPKSKSPEFESDVNNVFLEDPSENLQRGAEVVTDYEFKKAQLDMIQDLNDGDYDEDGIVDSIRNFDDDSFIEEIAGTVIPIGLVLTGAMLYKKMRNKEVKLEEAPRFFFYNAGQKTIRVAVVGTVLTTGSPIVVSGMLGYFLFKSKKVIKAIFKGIYRGVTSEATKSILQATGVVVVVTGVVVGETIAKTAKFAYKAATSETSKKIAKGAVKGVATTGLIGLGATYLTLRGIKNLALKGIKKLKK